VFGCFGFFRYTVSEMRLWELYSPKNFARFFRPERAQKFSVDFFSPHELMANFRDTPGDKSHKALDFLLRRIFWEGAPNLESLKDTRTSEIRRLADILEQAFFEVFGGFTWIERQFGGAFVIWLFEQVLNWTYIERGRLTDWCQRRLPSLHQAQGISTASNGRTTRKRATDRII
jgi:hypothetical protein